MRKLFAVLLVAGALVAGGAGVASADPHMTHDQPTMTHD